MDLVYPLRRASSSRYVELRYSLRSVAECLPHDRVWIAGNYTPKWARAVERIPVHERGTKWQNIPEACRAACADERVAERFALMNDDFFVMEPLDELPVFHRGRLDDATGAGSYGRGYRETEELLRDLGVTGELLNYELHVPLPVMKPHLAAALEVARRRFRGRVLHTRTLYGNLWGIGGEQIADVKDKGSGAPVGAFVSTNDRTFSRGQPTGEMIRRAFPRPSRYEEQT